MNLNYDVIYSNNNKLRKISITKVQIRTDLHHYYCKIKQMICRRKPIGYIYQYQTWSLGIDEVALFISSEEEAKAMSLENGYGFY